MDSVFLSTPTPPDFTTFPLPQDVGDSSDELSQDNEMPTFFPGIETLAGPIPPRNDYVPNLAATIVNQKQIDRVITVEGQLRYVATIPLRRDLFWSDGTQFNAVDVAYSYELARATEQLYPLHAASPESVHIVQAVLDRVDIVDDTTIKLYLYWLPTQKEWRDGIMGLPIVQRAEWESFYERERQSPDLENGRLLHMLKNMATIGGDHKYNHRRYESIILFKNGSVAISNPTSGYSYVLGNAGGDVELTFERN